MRLPFLRNKWYKVERPEEQSPFWAMITNDGVFVLPRGGGGKVERYAHHHAEGWRNLGVLCSSNKAVAEAKMAECQNSYRIEGVLTI